MNETVAYIFIFLILGIGFSILRGIYKIIMKLITKQVKTIANESTQRNNTIDFGQEQVVDYDKTCPHCGGAVNTTQAYCTYCGGLLTGNIKKNQEFELKNRKILSEVQTKQFIANQDRIKEENKQKTILRIAKWIIIATFFFLLIKFSR